LPKPEINEKQDNFVIKFVNPLVEVLPKIDMVELNERQRKAIEYIKEHNFITTKIYQGITKLGKVYSIKELNDLVNKKIIRRMGRGKKLYINLGERMVNELVKIGKAGKHAHYILKR